ncbi:sugar ABC transporter ATPase [Sphingobacterium cavernae]|uniref:sugar ABC transporter ATPase n=1 Tax=Sphingobacterium cavernae TaxID=2592657 RepID=UPI00122FDEA2|nr:sugar ABC transporter ATPase [Sphingobacterium cavernae]
MSDYSVSIVPQQSSYPDNKDKAKEILNWLISEDIIKSSLTDCVLGPEIGYAISEGAKKISDNIEELPFNITTNGLDVITSRQILHTGINGMDECICPNCKGNIVNDDWDFLDEWFDQKSDNLTCTQCAQENEINKYSFTPQWGFSNLGFTFWNWGEFKNDFIEEFQRRLGTYVYIVHSHI